MEDVRDKFGDKYFNPDVFKQAPAVMKHMKKIDDMGKLVRKTRKDVTMVNALHTGLKHMQAEKCAWDFGYNAAKRALFGLWNLF